MKKVIVLSTSEYTRGGITSVVKAHREGYQWEKYHCKWIETHRDTTSAVKIMYFLKAMVQYLLYLPFYDIVHIHIATTSSAIRKQYFLYLAKLFHKKTILHFHPSNQEFLSEIANQKLYKRLFGMADRVLVLSNHWRLILLETLGISKNVEVLFNPCIPISRTEIKKNQILFAGTIIERKGYATLLKAFAQIANKYPDWSVVFAGNGEIPQGTQLAEKLSIGDQVQFAGWVSGQQKELLFQQSKIYCLASQGEGFPMGVLDAWSYGIPCLVTPVGGLSDFVKNEFNAMVFPIGDEICLAKQLEKLIVDDHLRRTLIKNADELVNGPFNIHNIHKELDSVYSEL